MKKVIIGLLCLLAFGCNTKEDANKRPDWIQNPQAGAVGSCPTNAMGRHEQEELAIARARARLAATLGVTVDQITTIQESTSNSGSIVYMETTGKQVIKNKTIKAHVRATWYDRPRDTVWAWVYPVK